MSDRIFLRLNDNFALGADSLQWILYKAKRSASDVANVRDWRAISFVRSTKDILLRCMREKGCETCPEAQLALDRIPVTFDAWKAAEPSPSAAP